MKGKSNAVAIYLDAESAGNTIKDNSIDVSTKNFLLEGWDRPLIAIDGSSHNKIMNNTFSNLSHGGIYLYRNCGEKGVIRHQTPSHNQIINNTFYYKKYDGINPAVYLGSRDRGWFQRRVGFCADDDGYDFGSSLSDKDYATYNVVMQNQFFKRPIKVGDRYFEASLADMIKTKNSSVNKPNYIEPNKMVTEDTVEKRRPAGCYVESGNRDFISHGQSFDVFTPRGNGYKYTCNNGDLIGRPSFSASPETRVFKYKYSKSNDKKKKER